MNSKTNSATGVIFAQTLREYLVPMVLWGLAYSVLILVAVYLYPLLQRNESLLNLLSGLGVLDQFTANYGVDVESMLGFKGYLAFQVLAWVPLLFSLYVVPQAIAAVQGEEQRGTLDLLLSTPLPRWRFLTEKVLAMVVALMGTLLFMWGTLLFCALTLPDLELTTVQVNETIWHLAPVTLAVAMAALLFSLLTSHSRTATGLTAAFVLISFFIRAIADSSQVGWLLFLKQFSIFNYHSSITILSYGLQPQWDFTLLVFAAACFVASLLLFRRRNIRK